MNIELITELTNSKNIEKFAQCLRENKSEIKWTTKTSLLMIMLFLMNTLKKFKLFSFHQIIF